ncbi:MAG: hypothetical protein M3256_18450, partial [Actinomycetota bacterium]|nr:hypothetical protein [Actinomycetota bacterium]
DAVIQQSNRGLRWAVAVIALMAMALLAGYLIMMGATTVGMTRVREVRVNASTGESSSNS